MPIYRHAAPAALVEAWPDHLSRRLFPPCRRLETLSLCDDGRLALGLSCSVTVLNPSLITRLVPSQTETRAEQKPLDYALLDTDARVAQGIRAPAVGHEFVVEPPHTKPDGPRRDTALYNGEIAFLAWTSSRVGAVLFVLNGEGNCFVAVPRYGEGTWGGILAPWRLKRAFPEAVGQRREPVDAKEHSPGPRRKKKKSSKANASLAEGASARKVSDPIGWGWDSQTHFKENRGKNWYLPQNQVRCVSFARVFRGPEGHVPDASRADDYLLVGRKDGTFVFSYGDCRRIDVEQQPILSLHSGWSVSLACLEDVEYGGKSMTLVAVGGAFGELMVYGLLYEEFSGGISMLTSKALWKGQPSILFGTVASLSWSPGMLHSQLRLAAACGNAITVLDWSNVLPEPNDYNPWINPDLHHIADAHNGLVSSVAVIADNSVLSSSLDGTILRWVVEQWNQGDAEEPLQMVHRAVLHSGPSSEPVMALQRTPLGFGIAAITTATHFGVEVNDQNDDAKRKYHAGCRRSLLSLYVKPALHGASDVTRQILSIVEIRATTRRFIGEAVVMWDIELYLQQLKGGSLSIVLAALRQRFRNMLAHLRGRSIAKLSEGRFHHYARVMACLSRLIIRVGEAGDDDGGLMTQQHRDISSSVRGIHYDACMQNFLREKLSVSILSLDEVRALGNMCQFVSKCKQELLWDAPGTLERIRLVRAAISPRKTSWTTPCAVCGADSGVLLEPDTRNRNRFRCAFNDCFERCVMTGLPCTDVVPLVCHGCEAKAMVRDFDPFQGRGKEFRWIDNIGKCPVCLCALLPGSVEAQ